MPTATSSPASRWPERRREDRQPEGLVSGAAGLRDRAVLGASAADDRRELLSAGQLRQQPVLLERDRLVPGAHGPVEPARRALVRLALAQPPVLGRHPPDRGATRDRRGALDAAPGLDGVLLPCRHGPAAADPVERGRHHLAGVWARRHRTSRLCRQPARHRLQLHREPARGVDDHRRDGRVALDEPRRPPVLRRAQIDPGRLLPGGAHRRRLALGGVSHHPTTEDAARAPHRRAPALHGFLHDLYRAIRAHRRRARQRDHLPVDRPCEAGARAIRSWQGGRHVACLQPDHPGDVLGFLHRHDQCRSGPRPARCRRACRCARHRNPVGEHGRTGSEGGIMRGRVVVLSFYLLFLALPIYWLVNMSLKTNYEIATSLTLWPHALTLANYTKIFTDSSWYSGYINSLKYVILNTLVSITLALPAAYAFSRYRFIGDKHLFFWLLSNRMAPPAVFALPFFNLYSAIGLFDTPWAVALAHCLFNVPLAVWILEGFMSGVPREIDETAAIDGYSFPRFFVKIFMPLIASGLGVAAFFCFMFSWVELLLARTLTTVSAKPISATMTRTVSAAGMDWGLLAAAGVLTILPGAVVIWFVRNYIAKGFALGRV